MAVNKNTDFRGKMAKSQKQKQKIEQEKKAQKEKEDIKKNAKSLLDSFASKIEKIKVEESHFESEEGLRDKGEGWETDTGFKNTFFCNAPETEDNFIVAEKGGWK